MENLISNNRSLDRIIYTSFVQQIIFNQEQKTNEQKTLQKNPHISKLNTYVPIKKF